MTISPNPISSACRYGWWIAGHHHPALRSPYIMIPSPVLCIQLLNCWTLSSGTGITISPDPISSALWYGCWMYGYPHPALGSPYLPTTSPVLFRWLWNCWTLSSGTGITISPDPISSDCHMVVALLNTVIQRWDHHISQCHLQHIWHGCWIAGHQHPALGSPYLPTPSPVLVDMVVELLDTIIWCWDHHISRHHLQHIWHGCWIAGHHYLVLGSSYLPTPSPTYLT